MSEKAIVVCTWSAGRDGLPEGCEEILHIGRGLAGALGAELNWLALGPLPASAAEIAGRYGVARPLRTLLGEIVYLVETFGAGHLLFDDEDLARYGSYMNKVERELAQLPWSLTWEGRSGERRIRGHAR